jgi:hypothetical protein
MLAIVEKVDDELPPEPTMEAKAQSSILDKLNAGLRFIGPHKRHELAGEIIRGLQKHGFLGPTPIAAIALTELYLEAQWESIQDCIEELSKDLLTKPAVSL